MTSRNGTRAALQNLSLAALAIVSGGLLAYNARTVPPAAQTQGQQGTQLLEEAVNYPQKRQAYLDHLFSKMPEHVRSIQYADEGIEAMLKERRVVYPEGASAIVLPIDKNYSGNDFRPAHPSEIGNGAQSRIYVFKYAFRSYSDLAIEDPMTKKEFYEGEQFILKNLIQNNNRPIAKVLANGMPGYPLDSFKDIYGQFNLGLFNNTLALTGHLSERYYLQKDRSMALNQQVQDHLFELDLNIANNYAKHTRVHEFEEYGPRIQAAVFPGLPSAKAPLAQAMNSSMRILGISKPVK